MKLLLTKKIFLKHLDKVVKAINLSVPLSSLHGVLINATKSNISLVGSDGNFAVKEIINNNELTKVIEPGLALIPGKLLREIISKQEMEITIETNNSKVNIVSGSSNTTVALLNHTEYPTISFDILGKELIVDAVKLRNLIKNVSYASGDNDRRIILNGVNLRASQGFLTATATNSFRLAQEKIKIDSDVDFNLTILTKNLKEFLPSDVKGKITIKVDDSKIITRIKDTITLSKIIDGVYPDVDQLIPTIFNYKVEIDSGEIDKLIDRVTVVANDANKVIKFSVDNKNLIFESKKMEIGESKVKTNDFKYEGEAFNIVFNAKFLKDALSKLSGDISINFIGDQKPFIVKGESNSELIQLILPHRSFS